jgi:hypothetical protein
MAGHYVAMAQFLRRGYNVAVPAVDVGDDIFVVDDRDGRLSRVQVKSANAKVVAVAPETLSAQFSLSRAQLATVKATELYYMLMIHHADQWRYLLIPRLDLDDVRQKVLSTQHAGGKKRAGPPMKPDGAAVGDALGLLVTIAAGRAEAWSTDLTSYFDRWPSAFPPVTDGPGTRRSRVP